MSKSKLSSGLKALRWIIFAIVGVVVIRYGGELFFYFPGVIAKRISLSLTGSSKGLVTTIFFYLIAAVFVLALAALGWSAIFFQGRLSRKRSNLPGSPDC